jgi:hypothetical protein
VVLSDIPAHRAVIEEYDATGACVSEHGVVDAIDRFRDAEADIDLPEWSELAEAYILELNGQKANKYP